MPINYVGIHFVANSLQFSIHTKTITNHQLFIPYACAKSTPSKRVNFITNTNTTFGSTTSFSGTATENGGNIPVVVEDDYDVWFNDLTGHYILIPLNL